MNILVVSVDALPQVGGVSVMSHSLADAFTSEGHRVVFVGPKGSYVPDGFDRRYHFYEDWESDVQKRSGPDALAQDSRIAELTTKMLERYAIDRVLLLHPFYYAVGLIDACRRKHLDCSVYFHGFELRSQLQGKYPKNQKTLVRERTFTTLRERTFYTVGAANEILVNSRYTAALFEPFPLKPRVRVTGCGVPTDVMQREVATTPEYDRELKVQRRASLDLPPQACLAFVGRLVPSKRVDRLLTICKLNPNFSALIVGSGPDEERLRERAADPALRGRVTFVGQVSEARKWELLRAADFLCLLSNVDDARGHVEGFGIALLEGAAAGAVPVSSGTGGMADVVDHLDTGLVLADDDVAAAAQLSAVAGNEELLKKLVSAARSQIESRFTWTAVARTIAVGWTH